MASRVTPKFPCPSLGTSLAGPTYLNLTFFSIPSAPEPSNIRGFSCYTCPHPSMVNNRFFPHPAAAKPYACLKRSPTLLCESAHESRGRLFLLGPAPRGRSLLFISRCSSVRSWRYALDEEGLKQNLCSCCLLLHRAQSDLTEGPRV